MNAPSIALVLIVFHSLPAAAAPALAQGIPVPVLGRSTEVTLDSGARLRGELIEATDARLLLAGPNGLEPAELFGVSRVRVRQHDFTAADAWTWVAVTAVATGLGMVAACSQVEDAACGGVFPTVAISFGVIGGLFALVAARSGWRDIPVDGATLRAYARFPQGAPRGFR